MGWKEFLRPTIGKIILLAVLLVLMAIFSVHVGGEWIGYGFPMLYAEQHYGMLPIDGDYNDWEINPVGTFIDLLFWYIISSVVFFVYIKIKKHK